MKKLITIIIIFLNFLHAAEVKELPWPQGESFLTFLERYSIPQKLYFDLEKEDKELCSEIRAERRYYLYTEDNGDLKPMVEWPLIWRQGLVSGVKFSKLELGDDPIVKIVEVKVSDRIKRLELIGKHVDVRAFLDKIIVPERPEQDDNSDMETARRVAFILTNAQEANKLH